LAKRIFQLHWVDRKTGEICRRQLKRGQLAEFFAKVGRQHNGPGMQFIAVKSEAQQAVLTLHRLREQLVKMRTMQVNQLRDLLYEFGLEGNSIFR